MWSSTDGLIVTVCFGLWALVYDLLGLLYITNVIANRDHFEVRVRLPTLTVLEVVVCQLCITTTALREICVAWGLGLPDAFNNFIFCLLIVVNVSFYPHRFVQIILVFDSSLRNRYYQQFSMVKPIFASWSVFIFCSVYITLTGGHRGCFKM